MIKVILCASIIVLCGFVGYGVSNSFTQRKKFFFCFSNFLNLLRSDISFSSTKLETIIKKQLNFPSLSKEFKQMLKNYLLTLQSNLILNNDTLFKGITILSNEEMERLYYFFSKLGKVDIKNQIEEIDKMFSVNEIYLTQSNFESKKYSSLYVKLGIIIGAFVAIVII